MMLIVMMVMMLMCAVLTLLTGPTQRLLLTPDSSCVEPILDQFELTADRDNDDHVDDDNYDSSDIMVAIMDGYYDDNNYYDLPAN